ncbi:MAG: DUF1080 domain-containing protein [Planctomycetaceae bacterium]|nr:DUF1080 domain-containing protein [Planctomycetaceae bacterium]
MLQNRFVLSVTVLLACVAPVSHAQDTNPKTAYLTAEAAGPVADIQGEYAGEVPSDDGPVRVGVQIVAVGTDKLKYAAYMGGLPGDGWDGNEPVRGEGRVEGTVGHVSSEYARAEIREGSLFVYSNDSVRLAEFSKVQRTSPTEGRPAPEGAVVLFDGTSADAFEGGRLSEDGLLMEGVTSHQKFGSYELHLEFRLAFMPYAQGQARSNSGCYLQGRYEVQILDSFGLTGESNECGGIYEISRPAVNMCFPPLRWQTYDIEYHAAKFAANGEKSEDAWMTVRHNGVVVQEHVRLPRATRASPVPEGPQPGPVYLQNHGDPLRFRNIWVKPLGD